MTHWNDMINDTAVLTVDNAVYANQGIYSASYVGDSPLQGAWMRLIVRGLLDSNSHTLRNRNTQPCTEHPLGHDVSRLLSVHCLRFTGIYWQRMAEVKSNL